MAVNRARPLLAAAAALLAAALPVWGAEPEAPAGYLTAIGEELARLDLHAVCDDVTGTCSFTRSRSDGVEFQVGVRHGQNTHTVYIFIERYLELSDPDGPSLALARRLLDLNRQLVTGKFEWEQESNSIRLTAVLSSDSNFDRKAFRSVVLGLWVVAERLWPELTALAGRV
ncbi:MAG TPA: hypothetical protein VM285_10725 [Polyangia bacterium]|nr:hypothetical protein [Polyangia bacterium]